MAKAYPKLVFTWKYHPKTILRSKDIPELMDFIDITITDDEIIAEVLGATGKEGYEKMILEHVENCFKAGMIINGIEYSIGKIAIEYYGEKNTIYFIDSEETVIIEEPPAFFTITNGDDIPKLIEDESFLKEFFVNYYYAPDPIIRFICESYKQSLTEERFLVYLYDIKEAIKRFLIDAGYKECSSDSQICNFLEIDKKVYKIIGTFSNHDNINVKEGRHIGKHYSRLIPISPSDKKEIFEATNKLIFAFFKKIQVDPKLLSQLTSN